MFSKALFALVATVTSAAAQTCPTSVVSIAGSTTVFPVSQRAWREFNRSATPPGPCPGRPATIEATGTSDGANRVCGVTGKGTKVDIGNMSRDWKSTEATKVSDFEYKCANTPNSCVVRVPVAIDGLTVIYEKNSALGDCIVAGGNDLTTAQLRWIYSNNAALPPTGTKTWCKLFTTCPCSTIVRTAPSSIYGTNQYFDDTILSGTGETYATGTLYFDDNSDPYRNYILNTNNTIGFLGYSYYFGNEATLGAFKINGVAPSQTAIAAGTYTPLTRDIYSMFDCCALPETKEFGKFIFTTTGKLVVLSTGYLNIDESKWTATRAALDATYSAPSAGCPARTPVAPIVVKPTAPKPAPTKPTPTKPAPKKPAPTKPAPKKPAPKKL